MSPRQPAFCAGCGAHLMFVRLESGALMPVDRMPDTGEGGVCARLVDKTWHGYTIAADRAPRTGQGWRRFTAHFATCPSRPRKTTSSTQAPLI